MMNRKQHKRDKRAYRSGLRKNVSARYPIELSPLFGLSSIHRLCALLRLTLDELQEVAASPTYNCFVDRSKPEKPRDIQEPTDTTMKVHYRMAKLLDSVERPNFLHSATKKRSHVTNADAHRGSHAISSTDISQFYQSTTYGHVKAFFQRDLKWPHDVARLMASALTVDSHLPTGSAVSPILSYFTHRLMFERVSEMCRVARATVTLYIDDLTISGQGSTKALLYRIKEEVRRHGLFTHKDAVVRPGVPRPGRRCQ